MQHSTYGKLQKRLVLQIRTNQSFSFKCQFCTYIHRGHNCKNPKFAAVRLKVKWAKAFHQHACAQVSFHCCYVSSSSSSKYSILKLLQLYEHWTSWSVTLLQYKISTVVCSLCTIPHQAQLAPPSQIVHQQLSPYAHLRWKKSVDEGE